MLTLLSAFRNLLIVPLSERTSLLFQSRYSGRNKLENPMARSSDAAAAEVFKLEVTKRPVLEEKTAEKENAVSLQKQKTINAVRTSRLA
jgi:hypothetical protein